MRVPCVARLLRHVCFSDQLRHHVRGRGHFIPVALAAALCMLYGGVEGRAGTVTFLERGFSATGTPLMVAATLSTSGTTLSILLNNVGAPTRSASDVLTSFYFSISDPITGLRPQLTYLVATGTACRVFAGSDNDRFVSWTPQILSESPPAALAPSNLVAVNAGDSGWQFKTFDTVASGPMFGIGTVANSSIMSLAGSAYAGATFDPRVVSESGPPGQSMINLGIYSNGAAALPGDIDATGGIDGATLVNTRALFLFGSRENLDALGPSWIRGDVTFGFGTGPSTVLLPEPGGLGLAATAAAVGVYWLGWRWCRSRRLP